MQNFLLSAEAIFNWLTPAAWVVCAAAIVGNGILCAVGGDEGRQKAKKALPWVAVGCFAIVGGVSIAKEVVALLVV